ncbi:DNA-binding transcriptional regulator CsiR [Salmonella sp. NCTC 11881]|nr:DNA-binding transcriptional regulator CsiR [Salmonella sp. NCTC 11881]
MSLLTARYALGVGPLREALSQLVAERLVTVVNQKRLSRGIHVRGGTPRYF